MLIVQPTIRDAEEFADELAGISGLNVQRFPAWEGVPDEDEAADTVGAHSDGPGQAAEQRRHGSHGRRYQPAGLAAAGSIT